MSEPVDDGRAALETNAPSTPATRSGGRVRFTRVAGLVGIAVVAGLIHPRALAAVAVVAAVLAVGLVAPWLGARGARARWTYPVRRGQVGRPLTVRLTLRSLSPWPAFGLVVRGGWADPNGPAADPATVAVARVAAFGTREVVAAVVPDRRGVFPTHAPTLTTGFPFGIRQARRPVESVGHVVVWPELVPLAGGGRGGGGRESGAVVRSPRAGDQGEFVGTRPYRVGEPLHRIHWKQSARHDRLIAVEARAAARRAVVLAIETDPAVYTPTSRGDALERAVSVGASLAAALVDAGVHVTLTFEPGRVFPAGSRSQLALGLDGLARLAGSGAGQDALLGRLEPRTVRGAATWVVTSLAGWRRAHDGGKTGRRRFVLIDDRGASAQDRPPGLPRGVPLVPLDDPGHHGLQVAWKEVAGEFHSVV